MSPRVLEEKEVQWTHLGVAQRVYEGEAASAFLPIEDHRADV